MDDRSASRRLRIIVAITVLAVTVIVAIAEWPEQHGERAAPGLAERLAEFTRGLRPDGRYRPATKEERETAARGFGLLLAGSHAGLATSYLAQLGFSVGRGVDEATGRPYLLVVNEPGSDRAWGMYVMDLSAAVRLAVEVPHPNSDLRTEEMGLELFRRVPGSVLLVAGAHRNAAGKAADVAHRKDSVFHVVATDLAGRGLPQVQLHGFDNGSLPAQDVVISTSSGRAGEAAEYTALRLERAGLAVCLAWRKECGRLEGTQNAQGRMAAEVGSPYLHVEVSRSVREDAERRPVVTEAIAAVLPLR